MDSTRLSKGLLPSPRSRSCHFALGALRLTFFLQSQTFSLGKLGHASSHYGTISFFGGRAGSRDTGVSRALLAEVRDHSSMLSRGRSLMGSCSASPKGFCHLVPERKNHMVTTVRNGKLPLSSALQVGK